MSKNKDFRGIPGATKIDVTRKCNKELFVILTYFNSRRNLKHVWGKRYELTSELNNFKETATWKMRGYVKIRCTD
jgi:hypothetical protein